ncbi:MAG TPA: hypothetical protein H9903_10575 [Candidatus Aquabacterium excrementipullorum]|nr:hypothetical protein [Candidatus Aquabacterium excrementipullorum]
MLRFLLSRLREPSTLAGLGVLAVLIGVKPEHADAVTQAIGATAAAAAVLLPDRK